MTTDRDAGSNRQTSTVAIQRLRTFGPLVLIFALAIGAYWYNLEPVQIRADRIALQNQYELCRNAKWTLELDKSRFEACLASEKTRWLYRRAGVKREFERELSRYNTGRVMLALAPEKRQQFQVIERIEQLPDLYADLDETALRHLSGQRYRVSGRIVSDAGEFLKVIAIGVDLVDADNSDYAERMLSGNYLNEYEVAYMQEFCRWEYSFVPEPSPCEGEVFLEVREEVLGGGLGLQLVGASLPAL